MTVYEVRMFMGGERIRHGWVKTLDEATTYMDTFISGADRNASFAITVVQHKSDAPRTEAVIDLLNGDSKRTLMYEARVEGGNTQKVWRKNRKILNPTAIAYSGRQTLDAHPSPEHADAISYVMEYPDLLALCVKAPNVSAWQETTRRIGARQDALSSRRMRSYVWHWFHVRDKISP
jgi:hypothetical protein